MSIVNGWSDGALLEFIERDKVHAAVLSLGIAEADLNRIEAVELLTGSVVIRMFALTEGGAKYLDPSTMEVARVVKSIPICGGAEEFRLSRDREDHVCTCAGIDS